MLLFRRRKDSRGLKLCSISIAGLWLVKSTVIHAAMLTYSTPFGTGAGSANWSTLSSLAQFNPQAGTLIGITIELETGMTVSQKYENLASQPNTIVLSEASLMTVSLPNGTPLLSDSLSFSRTYQVPVFDQVLDFGGASGGSQTGFATGNASATLQAAAELALFVGAGHINLPVAGSSSSLFQDSDGSFAAANSTSDKGVVSVTYDFIPIPEGSMGWAAGAGGLLAVAIMTHTCRRASRPRLAL
jgi:hypothetical protein